MGMAASQARLLSITARLSNNEDSAENLAYAKQRLSDQTQQITNEYNDALNATKLTVLTGFNGAEANYEDISYNLMTGMQMAQSTKQYVVTDIRGRVLVTEDVADAYRASNGDFNRFLSALGEKDGTAYSQADLYVTSATSPEPGATDAQKTQIDNQKEEALQQIHNAWDKYFETIGVGIHDLLGEHENDVAPKFEWVETIGSDGGYHLGVGYAKCSYVYEDGTIKEMPINYEGSTKESRDLYDYAMALTEAYYRNNAEIENCQVVFDLDAVKTAANKDNAAALKYYRNLFDKIQQSGYFTYTDTPSKATDKETKAHYIYTEQTKGTGKIVKNPLKDNYTFEKALRDGTLRLEFYSNTEKTFKSTSVSEDNCIQEVPDERAIAKAEVKYNQDMSDLESQDKKFDLELKKLDTEHNALQTEYDSVKSVVDKNVESTFKIFS